MILGYHLVWTAYGWWLPNDPCGSMSRYIASDVLAELGALHYGRKRVQPPSSVIRKFYEDAEDVLKFPLLKFDPVEIDAIAKGFASVIQEERYTCYACALMPDHVHILIRKHRDPAEQMIAKLQEGGRKYVIERRVREVFHPVWASDDWKVFLDSPADIRRTIRYVEQNPINAGLPEQSWGFVLGYDDWPFHKHGVPWL
jgi:REP element-mobilizing transposase RayT